MAEVILALDLPTRAQAFRLLDRLPTLKWVKVGSVLMMRDGTPLVGELRARGLQVFLDLKWHDIPHTVAEAVDAARELGVAMATVHALGGHAMLRAAQEAAGPLLGLVGVTVLTSLGPREYAGAIGRVAALDEEVGRLASAASSAGLRGVVCSPREVAVVRRVLPPQSWIVVPGIRRPGDAAGDQTRTATPAEAVRGGATHLVVGRPVLESPDPAAAFTEISEQAK